MVLSVKRSIRLSLALVLCLGLMASVTTAEASDVSLQTIVMFHDDVSWEDIKAFADEWEALGVSTVMDLPMINGLVLRVPDHVALADLANDYRVRQVEADQKTQSPRIHRGQYIAQTLNLGGHGAPERLLIECG